MWREQVGRDLLTGLTLFVPRFLFGLLVFLVFWLIANLCHNLVLKICTARRIEPELANFLARSTRIGLLLFGLVTALGTIGINVAALVAGLGLTGFALGFALKDIISNTLAGILIIIYKPFRQGSLITVRDLQGRVRDIDLRYTILDTSDQTLFIPNSILFTDPIRVDKQAEIPQSESSPAEPEPPEEGASPLNPEN